MNNIVFDKITISNFLSLGDVEVTLSEQGFVVVNGRNKETSITQSNGSGKSSIFDAIFWTLTGKTLRGATDVVNEHRTSEGCACTLDFHADDQVYKIVRAKSHKELGNSCQFFVNEELMSDQIKKSQEMISNTIPSVSSEILGSIILLGQGLPYKFSSFSPSRRKEILETMSGSSTEISKVKYKIDIEESSHRESLNEISSNKSRLEGTIIGLQSTISSLQQMKEETENPEEVQKKITLLEEEVVNNKNNSDKYNAEMQTLVNQKENIIQIKNKTSEYYYERLSKKSAIESQLNSIRSGNCPTCGKPFDVDENSINHKEELEKEKIEIESTLITLKQKLDLSDSQLKDIESRINELRNFISSLSYKSSENQREIAHLSESLEKIKDISDKYKETEDKISQINVEITDTSKKIDEEQEYLECINYIKRQLSRDFKGYMLEEVIKFMSSRSQYYSKYLFTNNKQININLSGNEILIQVGERLYENLSGGERQRVDLAVQFALRDMLVMTSGFSCNLLVLDEAFDNLDSQGSDALIQLIVSEFSDIDSVFVITHHSEIDIPYDNQITVVKESDGVSLLR